MKKKRFLLLLLCVMAALLFLRLFYVYTPSDGNVVLYVMETGATLEEPLSYEEAVAVKRILWGKIIWPEAVYGIPACGFFDGYAIILNGKVYMLSMDSCGTLCVEGASSNSDARFYMNVSDEERDVIANIIGSRYPSK